MIRIKLILIIAMLVSVNSFSEIAVGDTFYFSASFTDFTGMSGEATNVTEVLDSIKQTPDTILYVYKITNLLTTGFFENGRQLLYLVKDTNRKRLTITSSTPHEISHITSNILGSKWIIGRLSDFIFFPDLQKIAPYAYIPVLPNGKTFQKYDTYTVRVNDTSGIVWSYDSIKQSNSGKKFVGHLVKYQNKTDSSGKIIPDSSIFSSRDDNLSWQTSDPTSFLPLSITASRICMPLANDKLTMDYGILGGGGFYSAAIINYKKPNYSSIIYNFNRRVIPIESGKTIRYDVLGRIVTPSRETKCNKLILLKSPKQGFGYSNKIILTK